MNMVCSECRWKNEDAKKETEKQTYSLLHTSDSVTLVDDLGIDRDNARLIIVDVVCLLPRKVWNDFRRSVFVGVCDEGFTLLEAICCANLEDGQAAKS